MAMPATPVATNLHKALNIEGNFFPEVTLDQVLFPDQLAETAKLLFSKAVRLGNEIDTRLIQNLLAHAGTDTIKILK
jgi:hypothetical protein